MVPQKLYIIHDCKSETYSAPSVHPARGQALRAFGDAVNSPQPSILSQHPEDFTMFEIGDFDGSTGVVTLYDAKVCVANGVDVKIAA